MTDISPRTNHISHEGTVVQVFDSGVDVAIVSEAACGNCKLKKACGMEESHEKIITVFTPDARLFESGDRVEVLMKPALGYRAMAILYLVPVLVVLAALVVLVKMQVPEIISGLAALFFLAVYYFVVYLFRERIGRTIRFEIRRPQ
jgi:sigma-E factor negative regulatory protein RseC